MAMISSPAKAPVSAPNRPDWLMARPIAHRGLHDLRLGRVENSLSAARAAIAGGFAIECDVILSRDGEAMVFHDDELPRLTGQSGWLRDRTAEDLQSIPLLHGQGDRIPTLAELLTTIAGQVPLVCEIKSNFDGDMRLAERAVAVVRGYSGPVVFKSFDPQIVVWLRSHAAAYPRGIVGQSSYRGADRMGLHPERIAELVNLTHWPASQADFISWRVSDLTHAAPYLARLLGGVPVMTWTVRSPSQHKTAELWADQIVFE